MDVLYNVSKQIKNKAVNLADTVGGTELEKKVKAATSNEHHPTPISQLGEIANATHDYSACREIMPLVWKRIALTPDYWRIINKTLTLLLQLIRFGSERVIEETRDKMYNLRKLESFSYKEDGKERGNSIRETATEIIELINDAAKLRQVREESARNRNKYTSQSSSGGYGGGGSSSYNSSSPYDGDAMAGPTGKYSGFGGGSDSYSGGSSYDEPKKSKKSSSNDDNNNDDPYGEAPKKSKSDKEKKKKSKDRSPSPSGSPAGGDDVLSEEEDKARKKAKKASKKAKEAAEAAKLNAPKVVEGGKLAPPPANGGEIDLFNPRSSTTTTTSALDDDFASFKSAEVGLFQSAAPVAATSSNSLDALFDFDGAPPARQAAPVSSSNGGDFGFGSFSASTTTSSSNNNWDAFASSTSSNNSRTNNGSSGFDLLSSIPAASPNQRGGNKPSQQQSDVFEAFQSSKPAQQQASAPAPAKKSGDAWSNDLVKLDLGSSKPTAPQGSVISHHIPGPKSGDPFSHLIPNQPRPMMGAPGQQPGMMRPGGGMMGQQPGMPGGFGGPQQQPGFNGMGGGMQGGMGMGMGMGMGGGMGGMQGGFGGMQQQQQPGFGFPQKKPDHNIFF